MEWVELVLPVAELADEIAALLPGYDDVAPDGVEVRDQEIVVWTLAADAARTERALRTAVTHLAACGFAVEAERVFARAAVPEDEWRDAWKRYFRVTRLGTRLVIVPSWEEFAPAPGDVVLALDPGRAFGTGAHASTRLCLLELDRLDAARFTPRRFADVGTGSGILAIAAARLWPDAHGLATDVDPLAVGAALENVAGNGVTDRVVVSEGGVPDATGALDLVIANIQADVLTELRDALAACVAPGGVLLLSGLLTAQAEPIARVFEETGLVSQRIVALDDEPDWRAVLLRRPAA
ncbi:MAG: hypothetical protein EXR73_05500 [Myxococcales bacterium]|nr:hypothetical protein [Myxococcales bacterium]